MTHILPEAFRRGRNTQNVFIVIRARHTIELPFRTCLPKNSIKDMMAMKILRNSFISLERKIITSWMTLIGHKYNHHDVQNELLNIMVAQVLREKASCYTWL